MIPLTPVDRIQLAPEQEGHLRSVAQRLMEQNGRFKTDRQAYRDHLPSTIPQHSVLTLHVDDFSVIPHLHHLLAVEYYTSRAFVRIKNQDIVAGTFAAIPNYAQYLSGPLQLGASLYRRVPPAPDTFRYATFYALLADQQAQAWLAKRISASARDFWIHPYMGHQGPWRLARCLARRCGRSVRVLAPPPAVTEAVNNKVWFAEVVAAVLGAEAVLESLAGRTVEEIANHLQELAGRSRRVALKLANGASGLGTGIFDAAEVLDRSPEGLLEFVRDWLDDNEWRPEQPPISIERWETDAAGSPSIQLWLPPIAEGLPVMEGIFDQLFCAQREQMFVGSIPSRLPACVQERLAAAAISLGRVFQHIGYVGRCSFDTILCGTEPTSSTIKFTECNGRWGGTSTPMTLMNRLFGDYRIQPYVCQDFEHPGLRGTPFDAFEKQLTDVLYDARTGDGWVIVYNVGCLQPAGKLDVITLGATFEQARDRQEEFGEIVGKRF